MKYYLTIKKNETLLFAKAWMDLEGVVLREMSVREREILYDFTYMCNRKNRQMKLKQTHRHTKETDSCQRGVNWETG